MQSPAATSSSAPPCSCCLLCRGMLEPQNFALLPPLALSSCIVPGRLSQAESLFPDPGFFFLNTFAAEGMSCALSLEGQVYYWGNFGSFSEVSPESWDGAHCREGELRTGKGTSHLLFGVHGAGVSGHLVSSPSTELATSMSATSHPYWAAEGYTHIRTALSGCTPLCLGMVPS